MIVIDAAPEVVLKAITDNDELTKWFPGNAILEPKVGDQVKFSFYKESSEIREIFSLKVKSENIFQTKR